ncbi:DUF11 domain-containing protein [Patescibacteria group bacterium]|nr:DUF11 domain-containing protein [Patescibacteria group bacterium]
MKHIAFTLVAVLASFAFLLATPVKADQCTTDYGGTTTCTPSDLVISKAVKNPITGQFVANLTSTDATFSPGSEVDFRLTVKNTSGQTFDPVTVKDIFPNYLTFVAGPGTFDSSTNTLTFTLNNLIAGETRTVGVVGKVVDASRFPAGENFFCVVNTAEVSALNRNDQSTSQLCIATSVLGATTLPVAGFNDLLVLLPFLGMGLGGFALITKKS